MNDTEAMARLLNALRPWRDRLVLVGGWAHRLHRFHKLAGPVPYLPVMTRDADVAMPEESLWRGDIGEALRLAGFEEDLSTDYRPPVARYRLGGEAGGFYAEFLAPLRGSGLRRDGSPDVTVARAGITAQRLRYVDILLVQPWTVALGPAVGIPVEDGADPMIANPVSFIAQKLLIQGKRPPRKRAQDALYIHDAIELFGDALEDLETLWRSTVRPLLIDRAVRRVEELSTRYAAGVSDALRDAARIPRDRTLDPRRMQQVCAYGLKQMFGPPG
jgi:hypothetical protein